MTPANEDAFFREVDEEVRRAQLTGLWRRWGKAIVAGVVVALALLAGGLYWQHRRAEARDARAETLATAIADLGDAKADKARGALDSLTDGDDGYAVAARLTQAGLALSKGDAKAAVAGFDAVAADESAPQPFRDLATIRSVAAGFDTLPPQRAIDRLRFLALPGSAWFGSAAEMTAVSYLKLNQPAKAAPLFAALAKDKNVPGTLRARALRISGMLGVDAVAAAGER